MVDRLLPMVRYPESLLKMIAEALPGETRSPYTVARAAKGNGFAVATLRAFGSRIVPVSDRLITGWAEIFSVHPDAVRTMLVPDPSLTFGPGRAFKGRKIKSTSTARSDEGVSLATSHDVSALTTNGET